jgi:hypothetical protein
MRVDLLFLYKKQIYSFNNIGKMDICFSTSSLCICIELCLMKALMFVAICVIYAFVGTVNMRRTIYFKTLLHSFWVE